MYSQYKEEEAIINYFGRYQGRLLDIGAYNAEVFSNSRQLIINGWSGTLIEASPQCAEGIKEFYKDNPKIEVLNIALNTYDGMMTFYDSHGAVGTGSKEHYNKWKDYQKDFKEIEVNCITFKTFIESHKNQTFDFISIDCEAMDLDILQQIELDKVGCKCLCIEWGANHNIKELIKDYVSSFGLKQIYINSENIIFGL